MSAQSRTLRSCWRVTKLVQPSAEMESGRDLQQKVLLGLLGSCLAIVMANAPASAQQQRKPNIVFIMGDDVGWFNIGAYHQRHHVRARRRTSTSWLRRGCGSPTTMRRPAARRAGPTSSPVRFRSAPV